jgi:hypothetical protein
VIGHGVEIDFAFGWGSMAQSFSTEDAENAQANHRIFCEEYPAERIFEQPEPGDWHSVFAEVNQGAIVARWTWLLSQTPVLAR